MQRVRQAVGDGGRSQAPKEVLTGVQFCDTVRIFIFAPRYAPVLGDAFVASTVRRASAELRTQARVQQFVLQTTAAEDSGAGERHA